MELKVTTFLLGIGLALLGPAAHLAYAQGSSGLFAVSQQFGLNQTDVFTIDQNGQLDVFWVAGGGAWQGPEKIGPVGLLVPGNPLAVSRQFGLNQTDVFTIDQNGQLDVFWVVGGGAWHGPEKIGPAGLVSPDWGPFIAVSQQFGLNQTDVFLIDNNGQLDVFWVDGGGAWHGPQKIGPAIGSPGQLIAASHQFGLNQTDVFLVDFNGQLDVFWVDGGGAWKGPEAVGPAGLAQSNNPGIAVSQQFGLNQTDVFNVDINGNLDVLWVDGGGAWRGPEQIGPGVHPGGLVFTAASRQIGLNQTDVFTADSNGQLDVFWVDGGGAWRGPEKIGPIGLLIPGGPIAASQQFGLNQTDVFALDVNGNLDVYWVDGGGTWNGPLAIY